MLVHTIIIPEDLTSISYIKEKLNEWIMNFVYDYWLEGTKIIIEKMDVEPVDVNNNLYVHVFYHSIVDKNYIEEQERIGVGI